MWPLKGGGATKLENIGFQRNSQKQSSLWRDKQQNAILSNSASFILQPIEFSLPTNVRIHLSTPLWKVSTQFLELTTQLRKWVHIQLLEISTQIKNTTNWDQFIFCIKITNKKIICGELSTKLCNAILLNSSSFILQPVEYST